MNRREIRNAHINGSESPPVGGIGLDEVHTFVADVFVVHLDQVAHGAAERAFGFDLDDHDPSVFQPCLDQVALL
jgi:hypothetical protein